MGRHTGDYLLGVIFLAAAVILQLSHSSAQNTPKPLGNSHHLTHSSSSARASATSPQSFAGTRSNATRAVLTDLPRGTRVVVGSLDASGARHPIYLRKRHEVTADADSMPIVRFSRADIIRQPDLWANRAESSNEARHRQPQVSDSATPGTSSRKIDLSRGVIHSAFSQTCEALPETRKSDVEFASYERLEPPVAQAMSATGPNQNNLLETSPADASSPRLFLLPHFTDAGTTNAPTDCRVIGEGARVRVYVDGRLPKLLDDGDLTRCAEILVSLAELRALPTVETWIGAVSDVDHNQRLSIVVTKLDRQTKKTPGRFPIFGCIRESDFHSDSDFCGDVIYVDQEIFTLPALEITALLAHEIVHAAIMSMTTEEAAGQAGNSSKTAGFIGISAELSVPSWLNEAVAHFVELQCCEPGADDVKVTENFQRRIDSFLASPGGSPIVAAEHILNLADRRGGCRGAGTLFLAPLISSPQDLQTILRMDAALDQRIEKLTRRSFDDVFRKWTLSMATTSGNSEPMTVHAIAADFDGMRYSLLGTAFCCFECSDDISELVIESEDSSLLQISIIEPITRDSTNTNPTPQ